MGRIVILVLLCGLFLTGCGQRVSVWETGQERGDMTVLEESGDMGERAALEESVCMGETGEERSGKGILAGLIRDEGVLNCVWHEAGIGSGDGEEVILDKLSQCERLVLRRPEEGGSLHSLEDLSCLPNLKSLVIDLDGWEDSGVVDFSPIGGLLGLEELELRNCKIRDIGFLSGLRELRSVNLNDNLIEDLGPLAGKRELMYASVWGNPCRDLRPVWEVPYIRGGDTGGTRGDPYFGIFMGDGYLMVKEGWGSSTGMTVMEVYGYGNGGLEEIRSISVGDSHFAEGYDVTVRNLENNTWFAYVIAMEGDYMVRVDLADSEHPFHKAFPRMDLYDESYRVYDEKRDTCMTGGRLWIIL